MLLDNRIRGVGKEGIRGEKGMGFLPRSYPRPTNLLEGVGIVDEIKGALDESQFSMVVVFGLYWYYLEVGV